MACPRAAAPRPARSSRSTAPARARRAIGLEFASSASGTSKTPTEVSGLEITDFGEGGVLANGASYVELNDLFVGLTQTGSNVVALGKRPLTTCRYGVEFSSGSHDTLSGSVVSANDGHGVIASDTSYTTLTGDFIGTDVTGQLELDSNGLSLGNTGDGVLIDVRRDLRHRDQNGRHQQRIRRRRAQRRGYRAQLGYGRLHRHEPERIDHAGQLRRRAHPERGNVQHDRRFGRPAPATSSRATTAPACMSSAWGRPATSSRGMTSALNPSGSEALHNFGYGVFIGSGASGNTIGGTATTIGGSLAGAGNVISGNGDWRDHHRTRGRKTTSWRGTISAPTRPDRSPWATAIGVSIVSGAADNTIGGTMTGIRRRHLGQHGRRRVIDLRLGHDRQRRRG